MSRTLVIGEAYTDFHLNALEGNEKHVVRLGGVFHSARAFHAIGQEYCLAVISPSYLNESISEYATQLCASSHYFVGLVDKCPNVMVIAESTEAGHQGYEDVLKDQAVASIDGETLSMAIIEFNPTDILIYPGKYDLASIIDILSGYEGKVHVDFQYGTDQLKYFVDGGITLETAILSTSSDMFKIDCGCSSDALVEHLHPNIAKNILLKENRGGSKYYQHSSKTWTLAPAFPIETKHSVGVGDCYNAVLISLGSVLEISDTLRLAAYISSMYSSTWHHEFFCSYVSNYEQLIEIVQMMQGTELHWEERQNFHIYIAGPDFDNVDTLWIDKVEECLRYHNFVPHRPVKENGLIKGHEPEVQQQEAYDKDIALLHKCQILIAVLINDDPGTYVELGWMAKAGKPTVLFDPEKKATNLFLKKTATTVCHTLGQVVDEVYHLLGRKGVADE
ncbi:nucleoside 2-deoxyribosyltransferase [Brevibacillus borstelensis]|uniref:nucleoside 2-deoxyribosyltransferase n=1 Tax=Brevibacillus borstelensis TaxID=45462 RepID=UPI003CE4CAD5